MRTTRLRAATHGARPAGGPSASARRPSWLGRPRLQQAPLVDGTGCRRSPPSGWRWRPVTETIDMVPFGLRVEAWLLVLGLAVGYQWAVRNLGPRLPDFEPEAVAGRRRLFMAGLLVLAFSVSWPIDTIGDGYLFSIHMTQYLLMSFVSAPLLVAGTPGWMLTTLTQPIDPLVRCLARPVVALALFNAVLVLSHWPALVGVYLRVDAVHFGMHALWMIAGFVFWLPILNRAPEHYGKLSPPLQMV